MRIASWSCHASASGLAILALAFFQLAGHVVANPLLDWEASVQRLFTEKAAAVVRVKIAAQQIDETGKPATSLIVFTGFFISASGQALTNATPVDESSRVWVEKDGFSYLADVVGTDERTNISLLQVVNLPKDFSYIDISPQTGRPRIGSLAISIASPLDFAPSPSIGLVTGFESHFTQYTFPFTYTRIGIPIGPAEGGAPVFDSKGNLLGISMASMPEVRSSYILPPKAIARMVRDFRAHGKVRYGILPLKFEEKTDRQNMSRQIVVADVAAGSPAARAGALKGDILLRIDGQEAASLNAVRDHIFHQEPGSFIHFELQRGEEVLEFAILLEPEEDHTAQ